MHAEKVVFIFYFYFVYYVFGFFFSKMVCIAFLVNF